MPFSPQPRKKGIPHGPQDGGKAPSCGHAISQKSCKACATARSVKASAPAPTSKPDPGIIDLPTEKVMIARLRDKIADKHQTDSRFNEKAATILSSWISNSKKSKP